MAPQAVLCTSDSKSTVSLTNLCFNNLALHPAVTAHCDVQSGAHCRHSPFLIRSVSSVLSGLRSDKGTRTSTGNRQELMFSERWEGGIPSSGNPMLPKDDSFGNWLFQAMPPAIVGFRVGMTRRMVGMSSSGGGLFGRPEILTNPGRFLFVGTSDV